MAIEERKSKAERRAEARAKRKQAEEEARKQAARRQYTGIVGGIVIVALVASGIYFALGNSSASGAEITIASAGLDDARAAAGCEVLVKDQPLEDRTHFTVADAPPADVMYADSPVRPTTSGPHYENPSGPLGSIPSSPVDERALTHNLEHGSVIAWFDPDKVDSGTQRDMETWMLSRQQMGFESRAGGDVFVSPYASITSGKAIALRAWGEAMDCDSWDQDVADAFIIDHWGTHGIAPERPLSPYPDGALSYSDTTVNDNTEAPTTNRHGTETDPNVGTESPSPTTGDASPSPSASGSAG